MSKRPNIILILSDQHNAKVLGYKRHPDVKTPNLDRMASEGVSFENAITQNPICTPSRVCYFSGQYVHNHGYYGLSGPNPRGLPNLFGHFRKAGYRTSAIGKIHCPEYWIEDDTDLFHETCNCSIGGRSAEYESFLKKRGKLELEDHISLPEFGDRGLQSMEGRPSPLSFEESQEGWAVNRTIQFIEECVNDGIPFFSHISLPRPHQCTSPCKEFWDLYEGKELTLPPNADYPMEGKSPLMIGNAKWWRTGNWALLEPKTFEAARLRKLRGYLGAVSQVDHAVGLILDYIRKKNIANNTIVIYASDHGDYATEHGIMEKAPGISSDAITRIPMIWWAPDLFKKGHIAKEIVETVDVSTTLCTLAGLDKMVTSDGKDILHLLKGQNGEVHSIGVTEFLWSKSIRKSHYRFVYFPREMFADEYPDGFGELYDLEKDPWEMENLYFKTEYKSIINEMQRELFDWLITTTRPVTVLPSSGKPSEQEIIRYHNIIAADGKLPLTRIKSISYKNYL